jgi:hypothetical protein
MNIKGFVYWTFLLCLASAATACTNQAIIDRVTKQQAGRIPAAALNRAFDYYQSHADDIVNKNFVTIVNYDLPSTTKRMHVINMTTGKVNDYFVAHGKNTGVNFASNFSNGPGSNQSSLGIYLTAEQYQGKHGTSMRLDGKEDTNSNARKRDIVFHGADYVSQKIISQQGRLGRSSGCLAVEQPLCEALVRKLKGKSVILVYRSAEGGVDKEEKPAGPAVDEK